MTKPTAVRLNTRRVGGGNNLRAYAAWKLDSSVWPALFEQIVSPAELQSPKRSCLPPGSPQGTFERSRVRTGRSKVIEFTEKKGTTILSASSRTSQTHYTERRKWIWGWILSFMIAETNSLYYNKNLPARRFWSGYCSLCSKRSELLFGKLFILLPPANTNSRSLRKESFWVCGHN